jgi:hypothetical protein
MVPFDRYTLLPTIVKLSETFLETIFQYFSQCPCHFCSRIVILSEHLLAETRQSRAVTSSGDCGGCSKAVTLYLARYFLTTSERRAGSLSCRINHVFRVCFSGRLLLTVSLGRRRIFIHVSLLTARVFRRDSPPTRSRRNTGSGGERSSMLTRAERCLLALKANE